MKKILLLLLPFMFLGCSKTQEPYFIKKYTNVYWFVEMEYGSIVVRTKPNEPDDEIYRLNYMNSSVYYGAYGTNLYVYSNWYILTVAR